MIKSWKHKGLKQFYETGSVKGIQAKHRTRLTIILQRLDAATKPDDLNLPGMRFHLLKGVEVRYDTQTITSWITR